MFFCMLLGLISTITMPLCVDYTYIHIIYTTLHRPGKDFESAITGEIYKL